MDLDGPALLGRRRGVDPRHPAHSGLAQPEELEREIAERKKAEETLAVSEHRFRTMAETMPTMVAIFQGTGHVYVNPAAVTMIGYTREELLRRSFLDYVHPEFRSAGLGALRGPPAR